MKISEFPFKAYHYSLAKKRWQNAPSFQKDVVLSTHHTTFFLLNKKIKEYKYITLQSKAKIVLEEVAKESKLKKVFQSKKWLS